MIGQLIRRSELEPGDVREMYRLFQRYFAGVTERRFRADLEEKDWVVRIRDGAGLKGFSSLRVIQANAFAGTPPVLYSGDTIVAPDARGTTILARTWITSVRQLSLYHGIADFHWLLLVSGFRTYRLLPVFWREFVPRRSHATPAATRAVIDAVARSLFGDHYDAVNGIVRFTEPQPLRAEFGRIPTTRLVDPHVKFFGERNPGHGQGDELVCWTRLSYDNLTEAGTRMWHAGDGAFEPASVDVRPPRT